MTFKKGATLGFIAFGATLAYYVSNRLSPDALNIMIGLLCGISASIPVSLGLLVALTRQRRSRDEEQHHRYDLPNYGYGQARAQLPQVIVVAPPQGGYVQGSAPFGYSGSSPLSHVAFSPGRAEDFIDGRDWRIIGENE